MTAILDLSTLSAFLPGGFSFEPYLISDILHASSRRPQMIPQGAARDGIIVRHHTQQRNSVRAKTSSFDLCSMKLILKKWISSGPKEKSPRMLDPFIDEDGLLRVGGSIQASQLGHEEKRPLIMPGQHHVTSLLVQHYHVESQQQGRHFTEGAVHSAGYWIVSAKRCVSSFIFKCITCRKLRGTCEVQKMDDLPPDSVTLWYLGIPGGECTALLVCVLLVSYFCHLAPSAGGFVWQSFRSQGLCL